MMKNTELACMWITWKESKKIIENGDVVHEP
jgi:hypothetical protein